MDVKTLKNNIEKAQNDICDILRNLEADNDIVVTGIQPKILDLGFGWQSVDVVKLNFLIK